VLDERPGFLCARVEGPRAAAWFAHEAGGHRWQRVPPTEKRGRIHSSTVTVAILEPRRAQQVQVDPADLEEAFTRGSGPGGQHRNKTSTTVILRHRPSGLVVRVDAGRSQSLNREAALDLLRARLLAAREEAAESDRRDRRRAMTGSGMRGDKIRTVQEQGDLVIDHRRGTRTSLRRYERGHLEDLVGEPARG
ncbi:MAG: PCRF domain-containing protein, partial [Myxococcales bacterium]|nr:PCRF domain-containing protein [Myxococcales bacterium]